MILGKKETKAAQMWPKWPSIAVRSAVPPTARSDPGVIQRSRRNRITAGCSTSPNEKIFDTP